MLRDCGFVCFCAPAVSKSRSGLLADAEIVSTDSQNQTITVRDAGETTVFGEHGTADCSKATLSAYNSDSGKTQEIGFEDLQVGDYVVIGLYEKREGTGTDRDRARRVCRANETKSAQD